VTTRSREVQSPFGSTELCACERAREQAQREKVEVVIHRPDGTIRDSDSYGNDPNPPKDRKH